jgi:replicative DNA helicase
LDQVGAGVPGALPIKIQPAGKLTPGHDEPALSAHLTGNGCTIPRHVALFNEHAGRSGAGEVAEAVNSKELLTLSEGDVYWDKIISVAYKGREEVFDLTVPEHHNFIANDIIVHNSIEQDADVVMFIYRAERYGIMTDEQGNSTAGIAEIIIGKQRNGPIGTVELAFVDQYARFENLTTSYSTPELGGGGDGGEPPPHDEPTDEAPF